jgi:hypothetical protein
LFQRQATFQLGPDAAFAGNADSGNADSGNADSGNADSGNAAFLGRFRKKKWFDTFLN